MNAWQPANTIAGVEALSLVRPGSCTGDFGLDINECDGVYSPAEDTFLMLEHLTGMMRCQGSDLIPYDVIGGMELLHTVRERAGHWATPARVLDMGCGTGALGIFMAKRGHAVTFADISPLCLGCARTNAAASRVSGTFVETDLFGKLDPRYDLVMFNGPYLPQDDMPPAPEDRSEIGGRDGTELYQRFLEELPAHLTTAGIALLLISSTSDTESLYQKARTLGLRWESLASQKLFFESISVLAIYR